jgi:hypothetical protein
MAADSRIELYEGQDASRRSVGGACPRSAADRAAPRSGVGQRFVCASS